MVEGYVKVKVKVKVITHANLKLILHIYTIIHLIILRDNFSIMLYYFLSWNMNGNTISFIFINTLTTYQNSHAHASVSKLIYTLLALVFSIMLELKHPKST